METPDVHDVHDALEPLHSMIYFAPEAEEALQATGLRPGRMVYFASRAAPLGVAGAGVVAAAFYNFHPGLVAHNIPAAWDLAAPADLAAPRLAGATAALRRLLGDAADSAEVAEAADLLRRSLEAARPEGRVLYAGHAALPWPDDALGRLWHGVTLLREYRGDGHVAALVAGGLDGVEALVTHTASGTGFTPEMARRSRGWSEEEWQAAIERLRDRGLLDPYGDLAAALTVDGPDGVPAGAGTGTGSGTGAGTVPGLTDLGHRLRDEVEAATDAMAAAPFRLLGLEATGRLGELGERLSRTIARAGAFPSGVFAAGAARTRLIEDATTGTG